MEVYPIREVGKIEQLKKFLEKRGRRDRLLFVMGINSALRIKDLLSLKIGDVLDNEGQMLESVELKEQKTRKLKRFPINESIKSELSYYLAERPNCGRADPLFLSKKGGTLSRYQAWRILRSAGECIGLKNIGTHSLRKTFGYHIYKNSGGDIGLIQKLLNHSASSATLSYIGIDREKMDNAYLKLNL